MHTASRVIACFGLQRVLAAVASVGGPAQFVVQVDDALEWPVGGRSLVRYVRAAAQPQICDERLKVA